MGAACTAAVLESAGGDGRTMKNAGSRAVSLVELLLALTLTGILATGVLGLVAAALEGFSHTSGRIAMESVADLIFRQIEGDLEGAVLRADGGVWLAATRQTDPQVGRGDAAVSDADWAGGAKPVEGSLRLMGGWASELRFGQAGLWLRFFTQRPDTGDRLANLSAPRAVSYQIVRRRLVASAAVTGGARAPLTYVLYRGAARPAGPEWSDPDSSFAVGYDLFAPPYAEPDATRIDNVGNVRSPRRFEQVLATDVVDFGVRVWISAPDGREIVAFPAAEAMGFAASTRDGRDGLPRALPPLGSSGVAHPAPALAYGMPVRVDVVLRILTPEGARGLRSLETRADDGGERRWWTYVERESRVFVRAFRLPRPLP